MTHGAQPSAKISAPLNAPEWWTFRDKETGSSTEVFERTWYAARAKASLALGCPAERLECTVNPCKAAK